MKCWLGIQNENITELVEKGKKTFLFFCQPFRLAGSFKGFHPIASTLSFFFLYSGEKSASDPSTSPRKKEKAFFNKKKIQSMLKQDVKSCLYCRPVSRFPSDVMHLVGAAASELVINDRFGFCLPRSI